MKLAEHSAAEAGLSETGGLSRPRSRRFGESNHKPTTGQSGVSTADEPVNRCSLTIR